MTTRFSKQKLAEAQEKKVKGGIVSGLLSKKHSKTALKAHEALFVDDLSPLMAKSSNEVMLSHIQKLVQALGEPLFVSRKLLDLEKKEASFELVVKSLSAENKTFKNKVAILTIEAENDKEHVAVLEKSLQVEKDFCKLKGK
nr:hypothetical protein CFP56_41600 [Quercus suber]